MNKKRIIALLTAAVIITSLSGGCTGGGTSSASEDTSASTSASESLPADSSGSDAAEPAASVLTADIAADTVIAEPTNGAEGMEILFDSFLKEYKYYLASVQITDDVNTPYADTFTQRREYIVNYLINEKVAYAKFNELGLSFTEEELEQINADAMAGAEQLKESLKAVVTAADGEELTDEELYARASEKFDKMFADCGLTMDDMIGWQRSSAIQKKLLEHVNADYKLDRAEAQTQVESGIEEAKAAYESDPAAYDGETYSGVWLPEGSRWIKHILLKLDDDTVQQIMTLRDEGKNDEADKLRDEKLKEREEELSAVTELIDKGGDFEELMNIYSEDGDTTASYLITPGTGMYMEGFAECALGIAEVGGTELCVTDYGYHIIKYVSQAVVTEEILAEITDKIYDYMYSSYRTQNFNNALKEWREEYAYRIDRDVLLLGEEAAE